MSTLDRILAVVLALAISLLDGFILSGPKLGLVGFLLSFLLAALGWFAGMGLVHLVAALTGRRTRSYRRALWGLTVLLCVVIAASVVSYYVFVIAGKTSYSDVDKALHLFAIFAIATAVRAMPYAATAAAKAEDNARRRAPRALGAQANAGRAKGEGDSRL